VVFWDFKHIERKVADGGEDYTSSSLCRTHAYPQPALDGELEPTTIVEFLLLKSLPDNNPTVVKRECQLTDTVLQCLTPISEELSKGSKLTEILWNFARYKDERRLTLSQNPHFYKDLPRNKDAYRDDFQRDPTEDFLGSTIYVLTDRPGRVYIESDQNSRAFDNVWAPSEAMIFKGSCVTFQFLCRSNIFPDVCGKLEGESRLQKSIQAASNLWYLDVLPLSPISLPVSLNQNAPPPNMTASSVGSAPNPFFADWREPIRRRLNSPDTHICVRGVPPSTPGSSVLFLVLSYWVTQQGYGDRGDVFTIIGGMVK